MGPFCLSRSRSWTPGGAVGTIAGTGRRPALHRLAPLDVNVRDIPLTEAEADVVAVGVFDDEDLPAEIADARGAEDARGGYKKYALLRPDAPSRVLAVGLGKRDEFDERNRSNL